MLPSAIVSLCPLPSIMTGKEATRVILKLALAHLVDDLYQSGVSMNYVAILLLEAGARKVFGLACEKTCSNDDNVSRR